MRVTFGALLAAIGLFIPSIALAQRPLQIPVQFDFINPGARSLALGGAFTGLADDATSAFTNPAGLKTLTRREMSIEGRLGRVETPFLTGGRIVGPVTNQGIDRVAGPLFGESSNTNGGLSFLSYVEPMKNGTLAFYRHELSRFESSVQTDGPFLGPSREQPLQQSKELLIVNYGASGAYRVNDKIALGAGLVISDFSLHGNTGFFVPSAEGFFGPATYDQQTFIATQEADDVTFGFSVGTMITAHPAVQIGAVFRRSPQADFVQFERDLPNGEIFFPDVVGKFRVPNVFSVGAALRPTGELLLAFEYSRVQYSSLRRDFVRLQAGQENRPGTPNFFERFDVPDSNEIHFGAEYVFAGARLQPAIRGGVWYDPDHSVQYTPFNDNSPTDLLFIQAFSLGEDQVHYAGGFGLAINQRFEVNVGADFASSRRTASVSSIFRF